MLQNPINIFKGSPRISYQQNDDLVTFMDCCQHKYVTKYGDIRTVKVLPVAVAELSGNHKTCENVLGRDFSLPF